MKRKITLSLILALSLILSACGKDQASSEKKTDDDKIKIYTTVYPLLYLAEEIGGKYVDVASVYPAGADEHTFDPSQKDIIKMAESDLFMYIGHNLEGFVTKAEPILEGEGVAMAAIGEQIDLDHAASTANGDDHDHDEEGHSHEEESSHQHGDVDPHIWLDPALMAEMGEQVTQELAALKPDQKAYFEENNKQLEAKLTELDASFKETIDRSSKKEIIVSHAAYGYWENRYGIEQIAVSGLSSSSEPSQKQLTNIMKIAKEHNLQYVLTEQNVSSKLTETIQKELGAESLPLHNLSVLTENDEKDGEDYFSLMEENRKTLEKALK